MKQYGYSPKKNGYLGNLFVPSGTFFQWAKPGAQYGTPVYMTADESKIITTRGATDGLGLPGSDDQTICCLNASDGSDVWAVKLAAEATGGSSFVIGLTDDDHVIASRATNYDDAKIRKLNIATGAQLWATTDSYYIPIRSAQMPVITPNGITAVKSVEPLGFSYIDLATGAPIWSKIISSMRPFQDWNASCYAAEYDVVFQGAGPFILGVKGDTGETLTTGLNHLPQDNNNLYALAWDETYVDPNIGRRTGRVLMHHHYLPTSPVISDYSSYPYAKPTLNLRESWPGSSGHVYTAIQPFIMSRPEGGIFRLLNLSYSTAEFEMTDFGGYKDVQFKPPVNHWLTLSSFQILSDSNGGVLIMYRTGFEAWILCYQYYDRGIVPRSDPKMLWSMAMPFPAYYTQPCIDSSGNMYFNAAGMIYKFGSTPAAGSHRGQEIVEP